MEQERGEGGIRDLKTEVAKGTGSNIPLGALGAGSLAPIAEQDNWKHRSETVKYSILCIFTLAGGTFTFKDVELICNNETFLIFNYSAMSDGRTKTATFPKATLCGWSVTEAPHRMRGHADGR